MIGPKEKFSKLWPRLKGSKRLVLGNHDDAKYLVKGGFFKKITVWRKMPEHGIIMTHIPLDVSGLGWRDKKLLNVHGHIHHNKSPTEHHYNVSCEAIDYTPIHIDEIRKGQ